MNKRIEIDPTVCHGKPVIRGTRVLVSTILGSLGAGDSIDLILEDYPNITREDVDAALGVLAGLVPEWRRGEGPGGVTEAPTGAEAAAGA